MARKAKYDWGKSRSGKYQKFETRLAHKVTTTADSQDTVYVDVAQCLSIVNRKLVRQGHVFEIRNLRAWGTDDDADNTTLSVSVLPRTWMMFNAYKKARSLWNQMNLDAMDALGQSNLPKWYDYKVLFDMEHFDNEINDDGGVLKRNLLPCDADGNVYTGGEWAYSYYEDSQTSADKFHAHMLGGHATDAGVPEGTAGTDQVADGGSAGLILAYQQSRGVRTTNADLADQQQNVDKDSPWALLFGAGDQEQQIMTALDSDNDDPPYHATNYAGAVEPAGATSGQGCEGVMVAHSYIGGSTSSTPARSALGGTFEAPLGLLKLDFNRDSTQGDASNVFLTYDTRIVGAC